MSSGPRLTRAELREIDRIATEELGIPSCVLMENAGRGAAECVLGLWLEPGGARLRSGATASALAGESNSLHAARQRHAVIFCGSGNNGGDGAVVARHLANAGLCIDVLATESHDALRADAALQRRILERMSIRVHDVASDEALARAHGVIAEADVLIDALLGTGFAGEVRPKLARIIEVINAQRRARSVSVVALDLPSGLDCDSGVPSRPTVVADMTVTFVAHKVGFDATAARAVLGDVRVVSIGVSVECLERSRLGREPT